MEDQEEDTPFERQREVKTVGGTTSGLSGTSGLNSSNSETSNINYVCPECDGKFRTWDKPKAQGKQYMERFKIRKRDNILCPFCGMERGQYDTDE